MDLDREMYVKVLEEVAREGVFIREVVGKWDPLAPCFRRVEGLDVISLPRLTGRPSELPSDSNFQERLLSGASDIVEETCVVAHELGHSKSTWAGYEEAKTRVDAGTGTEEDCRFLLNEEVEAWTFGRRLLEGVGFHELLRFDVIAGKKTSGYRVGLERSLGRPFL